MPLPRNRAGFKPAGVLANLSARGLQLDSTVYRELVALGTRNKRTRFMVEKAVDVMLAVDLVVLAQRNEYDTAYILSADGDYTHAVDFVRSLHKKVFAVSPLHGAELSRVANSFIKIDGSWIADCYI